MVHSLDRLSLADELNRRADQQELTISALLQVNIAEEPQKTGVAVRDVYSFLHRMREYPNLRIKGLMAMMPMVEDVAQLTAYFRSMRMLFEQLRTEAIAGVAMEELSMGMTHDFAIAAREGATMVRVGTALYT